MEQSVIFQPMVLQAGLMVIVGFWLIWARVGSVARGKVDMKDVAKHGWQGWMKQAGDSYSNQYELPVLFFALCLILFLTNSVTSLAVTLAWVFAVSRIVHALIHLTFNHIMTRFSVFFIGVLSLTGLFILTARAVF